MPGNLHIFIGNHLEALAGALAEVTRSGIATGTPDPLQPEIVLVQSKGMQRWISMSLASQNGICANMAFPFPNAFLEETYAKVIGVLPNHSPFDPPGLTFRIMALLDEMIDIKAFEPIRYYLSGPGSDLKRFQLSRKIADVFDQYLVFRPDTILAWESGQVAQLPAEHNWQALLWRRIRADVTLPHRTELQKELIQRLTDDRVPIAHLPAQVSVFGISYLPVFHVQVLDALAHRIPVNLFLLNPCRQYWADIFSDHQLILARSRVAGSDADPSDFHFERGNRLLSSWGQQGRQFFGLTHHLDGQVTELFQDNSDQTLLGHIQQDILDLVDRSAEPGTEHPHRVPADASLRVHVCHSPMREVEVLHDQLMDIMDGDSEIHPGDILVMTPDIGHYAPFIHAVFGTSGEKKDSVIPYTVADQALTGESRLVEGYLRLLQLKESRFEVSRLMELLEFEALRQRFGFEDRDLHQVERWLREANIRWGWDGAYRQRQGLPRTEINTWRAGLDRLIAGYALQMDSDEMFAGILPHEGIEGSDVHTLGKLIHYAETLNQRISQIPIKATMDQWAAILADLIDTFFQGDENCFRDMQVLRAAVGQLDQIANDIASHDEISFEVVRQFLTDNFKQASFGTGFMSGCVTFCAMLPMRSIPAKAICLLGLQHDAFPQELHEPGFSLIASDPRPGDRSKRNDDKYLFLEALLSARKVFYISYIGRDIQDNSAKPPSVLVSELLEYITQGYGISTRQLVTEHPLQPFSVFYFDKHNPRLFSYSKENRDALDRMLSKSENGPFFPEPLPPPDEPWYQCDLGQLEAFFANPTRFLLEQRLGIYLRQTPDTLEDREKFNLDPLSSYHISQSLLAFSRKGRGAMDHYQAVVAAGALPPGTSGLVAHDGIEEEVKRFLNTLNDFLPEDEPYHLDLDLTLKPFHIGGRIEGVCTRVRLAFRLARLRPKDLLSAFIDHLAMQLIQRNDCPKTTLLVSKDAVWEFAPLDRSSADDTLKTYLSLFEEGLQKPIAFFSRTSFEYAFKRLLKNKDRAEALKNAIKTWQGGYNQVGESQDAYINLCFKHENPLTKDFEAMALKVFSPLFSCGRELRTGS
jgi:exodeoxyribonuclease V gamma subunit